MLASGGTGALTSGGTRTLTSGLFSSICCLSTSQAAVNWTREACGVVSPVVPESDTPGHTFFGGVEREELDGEV